VGQRLRGIISHLSPASDGASRNGAMPHGFLMLHHVSNEGVIFMVSDFTEMKQKKAAAAGITASTIDACTAILRKLSIGDVLELTLEYVLHQRILLADVRT
jgi:hypothetical protein